MDTGELCCKGRFTAEDTQAKISGSGRNYRPEIHGPKPLASTILFLKSNNDGKYPVIPFRDMGVLRYNREFHLPLSNATSLYDKIR